MIRRQAGTRPGQKTGYPGESCRLDETGYDCIFDPHVVYPNRLTRLRLKVSRNRRTRPAILQLKPGQRRSSVGQDEFISVKPTSRTTMKLTNPLAHSSRRGRHATNQVPSSPSRRLAKARLTHSSNCVSSKGLAKKPIAPALIACSRIRSSGNAVIKIIGVVLP
jgi:hypothetical protein